MSNKSVLKFLPLVVELLELLLIAALYLLNQIFYKTGTRTRRGFFCDDSSLKYPYHKSTVGEKGLFITAVYIPLTEIVIIEIIHYIRIKLQRSNKQCNSCNTETTTTTTITKRPEVQMLVQIYRLIIRFWMGLSCVQIFLSIGKYTIGRLRPHFFAVCQPQLPDGSSCADAINQGRYIMEYICLGKNKRMLLDVHQSFPSGHSALSFYAMIFMALHLQRSFRGRISWVLRPVLQLFCIAVATFIALSRIMDHKHHWSDVLAGSILGTVIAVLISLSRFCENHEDQDSAEVGQYVLECSCKVPKSVELIGYEVKS